MLNAHCWRYMKNSNYDFCFPAGIILDEFERILRKVRDKTLKKDMEPEITTTLFHLGETFYDHFDFKIENNFHQSSELRVKITSETNRQTFLPNLCNFVSNMTRENLLKEIQKYLRKPQSQDDGDDDNSSCSNDKNFDKINNNNNNKKTTGGSDKNPVGFYDENNNGKKL